MNRTFASFVLSLIAQGLWAQYTYPKISSLHAYADTVGKKVVVEYLLADKEDLRVTVKVLIYRRDTNEDITDKFTITGDVGKLKVRSGKRTIVCKYISDTDVEQLDIKVVADDGHQRTPMMLLEQISKTSMLDNLKKVEGIRNFGHSTKKIDSVRELIETRTSQLGLHASRQVFAVSDTALERKMKLADYEATNIAVRINGYQEPQSNIILVAHYDTVLDSPGADDNGSGVAGMLELISALSHFQFAKSLNFVWVDLEEMGSLGSRAYASKLKINSNETTDGVFVFDMIGYHSNEENSQYFPEPLKEIFPDAYNKVSGDRFKGNFILCTSNEKSSSLCQSLESNATRYLLDLKIVSLVVPDDGRFAPEYFRASDHVSFWDVDEEAVLVGDTGEARNGAYHSSNDKVATLNEDFMMTVVKSAALAIAELAEIQHVSTATARVELKQPQL